MLVRVITITLLMGLLWGCGRQTPDTSNTDTNKSLDYTKLQLPEKPNILWLVAEDLSPHLPAFGDSTVVTPNLDRLAAQGVRYPNFFSPSGVCAPSRAAIALGMYPTRTGAMHMRTGPWYAPNPDPPATWGENRPVYEALPPAGTHMHSTYLRAAGYYATNNAKQDYQFRVELTAWDESSRSAHWRNRPDARQPFFSIFNFEVTHESRIWAKAQDSLWVPENLEVPVPPYLPDTEVVRQDLRRMYSNILEMDRQLGEILDQLEADGLLDNTIIFFYGDHGGPLPRSKRTLYDTGLRSPLIVRFPGGQMGGMEDPQLLSFLDLKPTLMSLAGTPSPANLDGRAWLGTYTDSNPRAYLHAAADDFDGSSHGRLRAVRDQRYKYIRNYLPEKPSYNDVPYRKQMPSMQELLALKEEGQLDSIPMLWFGTQDNPEALYDTWQDPFELRNLIREPHLAGIRDTLRAEMDRWIAHTGDLGMMPETEYLTQIWPEGQQPVTQPPTLSVTDGKITLTSPTQGTAIGYQWLAAGETPAASWQVYQGPMPIEPGKKLVYRAHRIGYLPSVEVGREF
ncbi:sulfatase [Robiginitalea sp. M366]|uniref:sulfatase family protein n=1 Tax=Robiginitalea aestuariiviva TaxID=3036903 RepID=UPI00240D2354|nr:sulfatase [Robiginitalea aestuariiviva]MDG1573337.1 sulfatase [Robiginitalea aestuariiviva]